MGTVINLQQYKLRRHNEQIATSIANTVGKVLSVIYNLFLEFIAYPLLSAYASMQKKKVVVVNY